MSRLSGWFSGTLSQGEKEVLIKSVAMVMPIYAMSCFKFPKNTIVKLTSLISDFGGIPWSIKKDSLDQLGEDMFSQESRWFGFQRFGVFQSSITSKTSLENLSRPFIYVCKGS